jgi:hypothetical protein
MRRAFALLMLGSCVAAGVVAEAAPEAPVGLRWRAIGRSSVLEWTTPGGSPVASYDVRGATEPIDDASFATAAPIATFPSGTPRPAGVLDLRELEEVEVAEEDEEPGVLETALYFAVRALDPGGATSPVAAIGGFELVKLRIKHDRTGRATVILKGRFATRRDELDAGANDVRVRLLQDDEVVFETTVPAALLPPPGKPFNVPNPNADVRRLRVKNKRFGRLEMKTNPLDLTIAAGDVRVLVDLGARAFEADATLTQKGRKLVGP